MFLETEEFIEPLDKNKRIWYLIASGFYGSYSLIEWEYREKKLYNLLQMLILWWNSADCDVNHWDLSNSAADTDIK